MHESYWNLAVSFLRAGKRDSASLCLEELIRISPHEEEREQLREHLKDLQTPSETETGAETKGN